MWDTSATRTRSLRRGRTASGPSGRTAAFPVSRAGKRAFTTPSTRAMRATPSRSRRVLPRRRRRDRKTHRILAVIGDGSLTGGMSFEALNHAGHLKSDVIVILNDNEMSISKNVGALSAHLNRIMTGEFMSGLREDIKQTIRNLPAFGDKVYKAARYFEEAVKGLVTPGLLFEELGFQYVGPVDGHNLNHLILNLANVKKLKGPILVHVVTKKGKGYGPAEKDPARFHGISQFDLESGEAMQKRQDDLYGCLRRDAHPACVEGRKDHSHHRRYGAGHGSRRILEAFPGRFYDIGIAEAHGVTFAAALALGGLRPFVAMYSTFLQTGLRPDNRGCLSPAASGRLCHRQERHRRRRTALPTTAASTCPTCAISRTWWSCVPRTKES